MAREEPESRPEPSPCGVEISSRYPPREPALDHRRPYAEKTMDRIECTQPVQLSDRKTIRTPIPISTTDHTDDTDEEEASESFSLLACWSNRECTATLSYPSHPCH